MLTRKEEHTGDAEVIENIPDFIIRKKQGNFQDNLTYGLAWRKSNKKSEESVVHW